MKMRLLLDLTRLATVGVGDKPVIFSCEEVALARSPDVRFSESKQLVRFQIFILLFLVLCLSVLVLVCPVCPGQFHLLVFKLRSRSGPGQVQVRSRSGQKRSKIQN